MFSILSKLPHTMKTIPTLKIFSEDTSHTVLGHKGNFFNCFQFRDVMNGFTYILLIVWFAWCKVFISGKLILCYISWRSIVEVVVGMFCVPSLWLLIRCVCIFSIRILYFSVSPPYQNYGHLSSLQIPDSMVLTVLKWRMTTTLNKKLLEKQRV